MTSNEIVDKLKILADELNLEVSESNNSLSMYIHNEGFCVLHFDKLRTETWFEVRNEIQITMHIFGPTISVGKLFLVSDFDGASLLVRTFVIGYRNTLESVERIKKQYVIEQKKMNVEKDFECS
ncbi:MAG: hypothetical protein J6T10_06645 [Methanobrevibacter sp.]|nr:hypothetical protein [Methanobrevibacter sp.]